MTPSTTLHSSENASQRFVSKSWVMACVAVVVLLCWIAFLYQVTGWGMVQIWWRSETFTHGFLVLPIVLWLIWRARDRVKLIAPRPAVGMFFIVALVALGWLMADLAGVNSVAQLAFVALLALTVPTLLGMSVTRLILFPLSFLFLSVPIGEVFLPQLMEWTADFTVFALRLSGIPVFREGLQFVIPSGNWSVVEACSGVRYLIASFTVGTLFAYLNYQSTKRRVLFILVAIIVPVVANWVRAYMIVMLGHLSGNKLAVGVDHLVYGWVFFGIVIMLMFAIGIRWSEPEPVFGLGTSSKQMGLNEAVVSNNSSPSKIWLAAACFGILVAMPHILKWATAVTPRLTEVSINLPDKLSADWVALRAEVPLALQFKPVYNAPAAQTNSVYQSKEGGIGLFLAFYQNQDYERKLISSTNVLVTSSDSAWTRVSSGTRQTAVLGDLVTVRTISLRANAAVNPAREARLRVWQIYWINGTLTANDYLAKAYSAMNRLLGRGDDAAVIVLYTPYTEGEGSDKVLESFLAVNYAAINDALVKAKSAR